MKRLLLLVVAVAAGGAGPAIAATPSQTMAHLRTQLAAVTKQRDRTEARLARETTALSAMTTSRNRERGNLAGARASLALVLSGYATERAKLAVADSELASSIVSQVDALPGDVLWQMIIAVNSRIATLGDSRYASAYTGGASESFSFTYSAVPGWATR